MQRSTSAWLVVGAWLIVSTVVPGCRRGTPAVPARGDRLRIVSLSPAISRTLVDFGLQGEVVGRTAWCGSLDPAIPVAGDLYEIDFERLIRLEPTHVLVQPPSTGLDPALERLAAERGWIIGRWTFNTLDDIEQMIRDLPGVLYPGGGPRREAAAARAAELLNRMAAALTRSTGPSWSGRTLLVAGTEPAVMIFGQGTYLDDILRTLGGVNASSARGWAELSLEDVVRLDPEAIILVRDSGPRDVDPIAAAGPLATLDTAAKRDGRVAVLWHPDSQLPSSAAIGVADAMRGVLARLAEPAP